jgi:hypothetical protein
MGSLRQATSLTAKAPGIANKQIAYFIIKSICLHDVQLCENPGRCFETVG